MSDSRLQIIITAVAGRAKEVLDSIGERVSVMGDEFTVASKDAERAMKKVDRAIDETKLKVDELGAKRPDIHVQLDDAGAIAKAEELKAVTDSLHDKTIDIRVKTNDKTTTHLASLAGLRAALQKDLTKTENALVLESKLTGVLNRLEGLTAGVKNFKASSVQGSQALLDFEQRAQKLSEALATLDLSSTGAAGRVRKLQDEALALRVDLERIPVHVETAEARAKLDALKLAARELQGDLGGAGGGPGGAAAAAASGGRGAIPWLGIGIGALIAGLPALLAPATNAVMGLASAFTSASAGVAGFGAVAMTNLKGVFTAASALNTAQAAYATATTKSQRVSALYQERQALYGLTGAQKQAVQTLSNFEDKWKAFAHSFQTPVFKVFGLALKGIETLMTDMRPVIASSANAFVKLFTQLDHALNSSDNKQFFNWLAKTAAPMLMDFGHSMGNIFIGLGNLMMAFGGTAKSMGAGWVRMTAEFAKWADGLHKTKGFHEFLAYARKNGPVILNIIKELAIDVGKLLVVLAPVSTEFIKLIDLLLKFIDVLLRAGSVTRTIINVVAWLAAEIVKLAGDLIKGVTNLNKWYPSVKQISHALNTLLHTAIQKVIQILKTMRAVVRDVMHYFTSQTTSAIRGAEQGFNNLVRALDTVWRRITQGFHAFTSLFKRNWNQIGVFLGNEMARWIRQALTWGENLIHMLANGIVSGIHWVTSAAQRVMSQLKSYVGFGSPTEKGPGATSDRWAPNFMRMYTEGLIAGVPQVQSASQRVVQALEKAFNPGVMSVGHMSPSAMGQTAAQTLAARETAQVAGQTPHVTLHTTIHVHGATNFADPKQLDQLSQKLAFYQQQKLRAAGVTR